MRKLRDWLLIAGLASFLICAGASFYSYHRYQSYEASYRYNQDHPVIHAGSSGHVTLSTDLPRAQADHWLKVLKLFVAVDGIVAVALLLVVVQERRQRLARLKQVDR